MATLSQLLQAATGRLCGSVDYVDGVDELGHLALCRGQSA